MILNGLFHVVLIVLAVFDSFYLATANGSLVDHIVGTWRLG